MVGVPDEDHVIRARPDRVEHGPELLGTLETVGEHRDVGLPIESRELGGTAARMLVRAQRPSVKLRHQILDAVERKCGPVVVEREIVIHLEAQAFTLDRQRVSERDLLGRDTERNERCHERRVGVEQRPVEVEDRDDRHVNSGQESARGHDRRPTRSAAELPAGRVLIPASAAGETRTRVETQGGEV